MLADGFEIDAACLFDSLLLPLDPGFLPVYFFPGFSLSIFNTVIGDDIMKHPVHSAVACLNRGLADGCSFF